MRIDGEELWQAWEVIRRGGNAAGPDGVTVPDFRRHQVREIEALMRELRTGRYAPAAYRAIQVPKPSGGRRTLAVATVRDRVVQRALHDRILPAIERVALDCSFAYRPGKCHLDALAEAGRMRDSGFRYALRADVRNCFDEVNLFLVAALLRDLGVPEELLQLMLECLSAGFVGHRRPDDAHGLPQGAVLSPIICNLVLTQFDRAMAGRHRRLIRFADDFLILCQSATGCERALDRASEALGGIALALNDAKTEITDFGRGFRFLGARLVGSFIIPEKRPPYGPSARRFGAPAPCRRLDWIF
jgi:group II intron reverse transcriptase/maturase